jgi:hypothetical protein
MSAHVPFTLNRAATAIVQSRQLLERARKEITLAVDIVRRLDGTTDPSSRVVSRRGQVTRSLEELILTLEETQRVLGDAWTFGSVNQPTVPAEGEDHPPL